MATGKAERADKPSSVGHPDPLTSPDKLRQKPIGAWLSLVERCVRDAEVAGSNPVAPTIFVKKPFGQQVEGLSHCGN